MATKTVNGFNDSNSLDLMALAEGQRISSCVTPGS